MSLLRKLVISPDEFSLNLLADKWRQVRGGDLEDKLHKRDTKSVSSNHNVLVEHRLF